MTTEREIVEALVHRLSAIEAAIAEKKKEIERLKQQLRQTKKAQAALNGALPVLKQEPNS